MKNIKIIKSLFSVSTVGIILVCCVAMGYFIGNYLDSKFNTSPYLMLIFSIMGIIAGFREVFILLKKEIKNGT